MKKNSIILLIILLFISFVSSFFIYNFEILKLNSADRKLIDIPLNDMKYEGFNYDSDGALHSVDGSEKSIKISYKGYINKLVINYKTKKNFAFNIKYGSKDYYNKKSVGELEEAFTLRLNKSVTSFRSNVNNLDLLFKDQDSFKINSVKIDNRIGFNFYLSIFIFLSLLVFSILYLYFKSNLFGGKIEKLFLSLILIFGSMFIILQPATTSFSFDDQIHFSEIYRLFEFDGVSEWPQSYYDMTEIMPFDNGVSTFEERELQNKYLDSSDEIVRTDINSPLITYNQVGYIAPGFVLKLCQLIGIGTSLTIILTKFSMLFVYAIVMYFAIKKVPRGKRIMSVFGLFPSIIFLSAQFSYDPPIIAAICLFVAYYLNLMENKNEKLDFKTALILLISVIIASFIKVVYAPLILLLLFIPKDKYLFKKQSKFYRIGVILIFILLVSTFLLPAASAVSDLGDMRGGNTSVSGQVSTIIKNPVGYIKVLKDTAGKLFANKLFSEATLYNYSYVFVMKQIEVKDNNIYIMFLLLFVFAIITDSYRDSRHVNIEQDKKFKILSIILNLGIIVLIWTALYISYTPVGDLGINGVQNRYFLPILIPFIMFSISTDKIKNTFDMKKYDTIIMTIISICILYSLYSVFLLSFCM
ncbi:MAG: DUF2142 domain-containing protein [Bacilli bacterium]|nr:DUF2142 domain-containing protein [Bacilli bacterium]